MKASTNAALSTATPFLDAAKQQDWQALIAQIPYAQFLGVAFDNAAECFRLPFQQKHVGNPYLPALHGGVVAGFMENAALLYCCAEAPQNRIPKPITTQIDYLRSATAKDCYAECTTIRLGRRVATIGVTCWQLHQHKPIATARLHLLLE